MTFFPINFQVTKEVSLMSRWMAIDLYIREIDSLRFELSMNRCSDRLSRLADEILEKGKLLGDSSWLRFSLILERTDIEDVIFADQKLLPKMTLKVGVRMLVEANQNFQTSRAYLYPLNFHLELTFPYVLVRDFMCRILSSYKSFEHSIMHIDFVLHLRLILLSFWYPTCRMWWITVSQAWSSCDRLYSTQSPGEAFVLEMHIKNSLAVFVCTW